MRWMKLCGILLCLGGCGVSNMQQARDQARTDISACRGTYPSAKGSLAQLVHCETAADVSYAQWLAPRDVSVLRRYADALQQRATDVDQGRMTMSAWWHLVRAERSGETPTNDSRLLSLLALLPAPASGRAGPAGSGTTA